MKPPLNVDVALAPVVLVSMAKIGVAVVDVARVHAYGELFSIVEVAVVL